MAQSDSSCSIRHFADQAIIMIDFSFNRLQVNDSTTLHLAAAGGHADVVKFLLEAGSSATDEDAVSSQI